MTPFYDIIIIGKGLAGSAAARHLSHAKLKAAIIGPDEPKENENPLVYASHYDQARVQRIVGKDEVWTRLNMESVSQYEYLREESGIDFHRGTGCLYVNPYGPDKYLERYPEIADQYGIPYSLLDNQNGEINRYSGMQFPGKSAGVFETAPSGLINPRELLKAQLRIFSGNGGSVFADTVTGLTRDHSNDFEITTASGKKYHSAAVLVATGSFLNCFDILPTHVSLKTKTEVIMLIRVHEDKMDLYHNMPSLLFESDEDETEGIYMIQPVKYPDGNYYLKIGANSPYDFYFEDLKQIQDWFSSGDISMFAPPLLRVVKKILPTIDTGVHQLKKCIISRTAHGRPYIGETTASGLYLAGGCNGYSAMCSDAIGKTAAELIVSGKIPEYFPPNSFEILYDRQ